MIENFTKGELLAVIDYHINILNLYIKEEKRVALSDFAEDLPPVPVASGKKIVECLKTLDWMNNECM